MGIVEFAKNPWGQDVPIHIFFYLIWVSVIAGLAFLVIHAIWARYFAKPDAYAEGEYPAPPSSAIPEKVARHSLAARLFHWVMAAAMFALLITAFLPRMSVKFPWVTYHWIAGLVLTASILFHIVHASFFMDFWSIWPNKTDREDAHNKALLMMGKAAPLPRRSGKYPLENQMYHLIIVLTGLAVMCTGIFMMFRVRTPLFPRNPYLFSDMTWGMMYALHGLAGVGLIALIMAHVYFALRPEKLAITKSMVFGSMSREHYLEHHDPRRWAPASMTKSAGSR